MKRSCLYWQDLDIDVSVNSSGINALTFAISPKCNVLIRARTPQLFDNELSLMFVLLRTQFT